MSKRGCPSVSDWLGVAKTPRKDQTEVQVGDKGPEQVLNTSINESAPVSTTNASSPTQTNSPCSDQVEADVRSWPAQSSKPDLSDSDTVSPSISFLSGRNKNLKVPAQKAEKRIWNFQNRWYDEYEWLHYDEQLNRVLCFVCAEAKSAGLFSNSLKTEEAFTSVGYYNWRRGNENLRKHDISQQHKEAVRKLFVLKKSPISLQLSSTTLKKQEQARIALRSMFTSIIYLAKQGLPLRGSDHDGGNFIELLNLRSGDIEELKSWLRREKSLTSWDIQNEILKTISHFILRRIVAIVKSAKLYSLVVDETSDCSVKEQVSISVRIVNEKLELEEYFLGHYETTSTTGEVLEKIIVDAYNALDSP